ncbi:uncharacterized protein LOC142612852 [Castanea sativa]|uniref:uncharacterized protein LOC142612852 n=1 Tax=Castanea sativa TaxID=21020 RepID=UPI003F64D1CB
MGSESPQRVACCFCFSTNKNGGKKSRRYEVSGSNIEGKRWGKNDEILSDLSTFSVKEQERKLKKALEEEEKISREAEKVVKWVKQESARMDVSVIKTVLSNHEEETTK